MAVLLCNTQLRVRRKTRRYARDEHGMPVAAAAFEPDSPAYPGAIVEPPDGESSTTMPWTARADVRLWPIGPDDVLVDSDEREFVVRTSKKVVIPGYGFVDFIKIGCDASPPYTK